MNYSSGDDRTASTASIVDREASSPSYSWYTVPEDVKQLLQLAAESWEDTTRSEHYMHQALAISNNDPDVLISAYRYFFYKQNYPLALRLAETVLSQIQQSEQFPEDWEQLKPILTNRKDDPTVRLYLNAYSALGFVLARLGDLETAKRITAHIKEIEFQREFGATVVFEVLTAPPEDDED